MGFSEKSIMHPSDPISTTVKTVPFPVQGQSDFISTEKKVTNTNSIGPDQTPRSTASYLNLTVCQDRRYKWI